MAIDAMGRQRVIAEKIVDKEADYILAVRENQGHLLEEIKDSFQMLAADALQTEIDCAHGRVERRRCSVIADLSLSEKAAERASLQGSMRIESERFHKVADKTEREIRYYITSLKPDARRLNQAIRQHWGLKTSCNGPSVSASAKTSTLNASTTRLKISICSIAWPSTCSGKTKPRNSESKEND